jgi:hypothetical protein
MARFDRDAEARGLVQQGIEYRTRAIGIGEQLAIIFLMEPDTKLFEERCRSIGRKRAQYVPNDTRRTSPEIALGHDPVGDIATGTAADQDLGAHLPCAVEAPDAQAGRPPDREDGRRESSRSCPDDHDICIRRQAIYLGVGSWELC